MRELKEYVGNCRGHGGRAPEGYLDFSAPLNPLGTPEVIKKLILEAVTKGAYSKYPDYEYDRLRGAIAGFYGIEAEGVVPLNGASEALYLLLLTLRPDTLVVFEPTFGDHGCLSKTVGLKIVPLQYIESGLSYELPMQALRNISALRGSKALVMLSNPNNPTGAVLSIDQVKEVLEVFTDSVVVVDEAYLELCYSCDSAGSLRLTKSYDNLVVLRSLTKIYVVPGLRVGFLYTSNAKLANVVENSRPPWNVNSIAEEVFSTALSEHAGELKSFISLSRDVVRLEGEHLSRGLKSLGLTVYRSSVPYFLVKHDRVTTSEVVKALSQRGIYIKDASVYLGLSQYHARVAVRLRHENEVLLSAYREVLQSVRKQED
ncbi:MAG: histidinol-phosphate transaminase [Fervidicoccaceae archaeon]